MIETSPISYQVTFTETVVGFDAIDVAIINGVLSNFAGTAESYSFDVTPSATGTVNVRLQLELQPWQVDWLKRQYGDI